MFEYVVYFGPLAIGRTRMPHFHDGDATHWYCHVEMDVLDANAAREYLREQTLIEEQNGMHSFEFFADDYEHPTHVVLVECFRDDSSQAAHLENIRSEQFMQVFTNFEISVYGNPPQATIDRMREHGFWPPAFSGTFRHYPYFVGFRE